MNTLITLFWLYLLIAGFVLCWGTLLWFLEGRKGAWTEEVFMEFLGRDGAHANGSRHRRLCPGPRPRNGHRRPRAATDDRHTRYHRRVPAAN